MEILNWLGKFGISILIKWEPWVYGCKDFPKSRPPQRPLDLNDNVIENVRLFQRSKRLIVKQFEGNVLIFPIY